MKYFLIVYSHRVINREFVITNIKRDGRIFMTTCEESSTIVVVEETI